MIPQPIAVAGVSISDRRSDTEHSLEEMVHIRSTAALADAGLSAKDLDGVILSGCDQVDGRVIDAMVTTGPAAGVGRDMTMIPSSSEHAFAYAVMRLLSGQGENLLLLGWAKPSESVNPEHAELVSAEPFILRPIGMNQTVAAALQASRLVGSGGPPPNGDESIIAWPLHHSELPAKGSDGVTALILTTEDGVPSGAETAWVTGLGWSTDRYELGDRDLADLTSLRNATKRAYDMADDPSPSVLEVHTPSAPALERAVSILSPTGGAEINPSGGFDTAHPEHAAGIARIAHAAQRAREGAGTTVGASLHGFAGQGAAVTVFDTERRAA